MKLLREIIEPHLETLLGSKGIERGMWASALEPSRESDQGDLTLPCFAFASILRQAPQQIADAISDDQVYIPKRDGEMDTTFADITKINEVIGWKPQIDVLDWLK